METIEFMRPHLKGARFKDGTIPLEVLRDLSVLEEMVIEVAKWRFLKEHPDRQRSPRGFAENLEMRLTRIEDGSAIPVLALFLASSYLPGLDPTLPYFDQAKEAIVSAIDAAEKYTPITEHLPEKILCYFDRMGRSLRDGETMEFTSSAHPTPVQLNKETRRRLVLASPRVQAFTEEVTVRGSISEMDQKEMSFHIQLFDKREILASFSEQHQETVLEAFNGYRSRALVRVKGIGKYDRQNHLLKFESVEHVTPLDPLDVGARLDELRTLKDGWFDGQGVAPNPVGLDWLMNVFEQKYPNDLPLPHLYPIPEGGMQVEWSIPPCEISLQIDLANHQGEWHSLDLNTDREETKQLPLDEDAAWSLIGNSIRDLSGGME